MSASPFQIIFSAAYEKAKPLLWSGIRQYVRACGGDPDKHVDTSIDKAWEEAVIETALRHVIAHAIGFDVAPPKRVEQ